jgi:HD-like signal output (HDOD) protein
MSMVQFFRKFMHKEEEVFPSSNCALRVSEAGHFSVAFCKQSYYHYLFEGSEESLLTVPQKLVIEMVVNSLRKKEQRALAVPRLPSIIPKLLRSLRDPKSSASDYVAIINKDPVMSAAVLKLANSAYFSPTGYHFEEIDKAVIKLGIDGLRSVLSAAVMQPIIQRESPYFSQTGQRLWLHSLNCAIACEAIGQTRQMDRYKVYLMGLVHDIGKITLFSELCKQFKLNSAGEHPGHSAFAPSMKKISAHLSYLIACDWNLPDDICYALKQQIGLNSLSELDKYGHLLYQANLASEMYAITPTANRKSLDPIIDELNLPKTLWATLDKIEVKI